MHMLHLMLCDPAAGKTLTVHAVARGSARQATDPAATPVLLSINCMTLQTPSQVFRRILDGLSAPQLACCPADAFVCPGACHQDLPPYRIDLPKLWYISSTKATLTGGHGVASICLWV